MVIELNQDIINMLNEIFDNNLSSLNVAQVVVNERKKGLIISNVPVGELFSSEIDKKTRARSITVYIDKEKKIDVTK